MIRGALVLIALLAVAAPAVAAPERHSGRVIQVGSGNIVLEEMGPWQGPGTGLVTRTIALTPRTVLRLVRPVGQWDDRSGEPGYQVQALDPRELTPGDYVTVITEPEHRTAAEVSVVRP